MTLDIAESSPAADTTDMLEHLLREPASLDPEVLLVDENVRETFDSTFESDPELIELLAAVREHGVKIPIIAELTADGGIGVVEGQLRTLAARKAGLDTIPAWVRRAPDLDDKTRKLARMTEQIVANDRRVALTNSDRAKAVALMLDLGMSVTKVSKAIQMKKVDVKPTAMIGKSPTARRLYDDHVLDLAQLSVIAEFENAGDTDAVTRLEQADARDFGSTAHLLRSERERAQARRAETDRYIEYGYRVLTDDDFPQADDDYVPVEDVRTLDGREVTPASTREHAASWAVYLEHLHDEDDVTDAETGLPVDPDAVDWNTREFPAAEAAQGMRHADTVNLSPFRPWFYIRPEDMTAADVTPAPSDADIKSDRTEPTAPAGRDGNFDDQPVADLVAPEDAVEGPDDIGEPDDPREARVEAEQLAAEQAARVEAARWEAQRQAAERREAERRAAARIDKLGEKAKAVNAARRDWLIDNIVARKTLTKDEALFVAESLLRDPELLSRFGATGTALRLLGFPDKEQAIASVTDLSRGRADVYIYVLVLAGYEWLIDKDLWRLPTSRPVRGTREDVMFYLRFLATRGYPLVAIERAGLGELDPDSIEIDL